MSKKNETKPSKAVSVDDPVCDCGHKKSEHGEDGVCLICTCRAFTEMG
jgi:hypothetical protein